MSGIRQARSFTPGEDLLATNRFEKTYFCCHALHVHHSGVLSQVLAGNWLLELSKRHDVVLLIMPYSGPIGAALGMCQ